VMINANGRNRDDRKFACEVTVSVIDLMNPGDLVFTIRNIEKRREIMTAYRSKVNAFAISASALFVCDSDGRLCETNEAFRSMFELADESAARAKTFADFMNDDPLPENFRKALAGEKTVTELVAEGDGEDRPKLEITLAPNVVGRKTVGVVGCVEKV